MAIRDFTQDRPQNSSTSKTSRRSETGEGAISLFAGLRVVRGFGLNQQQRLLGGLFEFTVLLERDLLELRHRFHGGRADATEQLDHRGHDLGIVVG